MSAPRTWREYFDARRDAHKAKDDAQREFNAAGERFHRCDDRLHELKAWAERTHETAPFTGENYDEPVRAPKDPSP